MGHNVYSSQCECLNVWVLFIGAWTCTVFQCLWKGAHCGFENGVLHVSNSNSSCSLGTWWGRLRILLRGDLEPQQLSQDKARVRGSPSCLLYIFAVAAKVWESLFSLLTGEFEARHEVGGFVPSIRNRVTLISLVNSLGRWHILWFHFLSEKLIVV